MKTEKENSITHMRALQKIIIQCSQTWVWIMETRLKRFRNKSSIMSDPIESIRFIEGVIFGFHSTSLFIDDMLSGRKMFLFSVKNKNTKKDSLLMFEDSIEDLRTTIDIELNGSSVKRKYYFDKETNKYKELLDDNDLYNLCEILSKEINMNGKTINDYKKEIQKKYSHINPDDYIIVAPESSEITEDERYHVTSIKEIDYSELV